MKEQQKFLEEALFRYYLVSSPFEEYVHCQLPFYIDKVFYQKTIDYAKGINELALSVLKGVYDEHKDLLTYLEDFPLKERLLNLSCPIAPMFWTRFDTFREEESTSVLFAELNYDKPCAQKEIALAGACLIEENINSEFENQFKKELIKICKGFKKDKKNYYVAVLVDPCHYEELHLAYYFKHLLQDTPIDIIQVGPNNLSVQDGRVYAFEEREVDIILRLFPTEYLYEVDDIKEILDCFEKGSILIINDPRVITIQIKSFFAYLWKLVKEKSSLLRQEEVELIRECIPYTQLFDKERFENIIANKDKYVVKPSFGRYSEEVYIGKLYTQEEWNRQLEEVLKSDKLFIVQDIIDIKKEYTYELEEGGMTSPCRAYGNFGTYLTNQEVAGMCVRWSNDFLTNNETTWMSPIGIKDYGIEIKVYEQADRKILWDKVNERAIFEYHFTGGYYNTDEYISLDEFTIDYALYEQINKASREFCSILEKTANLLTQHFDMFSYILGIPENLNEWVLNNQTKKLCALGRIDFVLDQEGKLKILEFNSETPAGVVESIGVSQIIYEEKKVKNINPNQHLRLKIRQIFGEIIEAFAAEKGIKNIAFVCGNDSEDIYTTQILADICDELEKHKVIVGNIYDLEARGDEIYLYGEKVDALYRHYPLDWFDREEEGLRVCQKNLEKTVCMINSPYTLITQSKAFFAVIYKLLTQGFFSEEESQFIREYIPYTCLEPDRLLSHDFVVKPYFSREGFGVELGHQGILNEVEDVIFQDRVNILPVSVNRYTTLGKEKSLQFPVIGMYIAGNEPAGIFTRIGGFVTNSSANFIPTYIKKDKGDESKWVNY